jgi:Camelysin metallo-endopeptidase
VSTATQFGPPRGIRFESARNGRNPAWVLRLAVAFVSLLVISALIMTTSRAAFTMTTDNSGNSFTAGNVDLVDDDAGATRFTVTAMAPGDTITRCIEVTYNGTVDPQVVRLYSGGFIDSGNFGDYLNVTVDEGTGGDFAGCAGFVEDDAGAEFANTLTFLDATHNNYGNGFGEWDPSAAGQIKTYQITVELDAATPAVEQSESVTALLFTWEVQS